MEFSAFMQEEGYHIIPISGEHQLQYGCNVLNLGDGRIISVHGPSARQVGRRRALFFGAGAGCPALRCSIRTPNLPTPSATLCTPPLPWRSPLPPALPLPPLPTRADRAQPPLPR